MTEINCNHSLVVQIMSKVLRYNVRQKQQEV